MVVSLGGEVYASIDEEAYTLEYDLYLQGLLEECGVVEIMRSDRPREEAARDMLRAIAVRGKSTDFIAGFLKPVDGRWTAAWAAETAAKLAKVTDPASRAEMLRMLPAGVASFFVAGPR